MLSLALLLLLLNCPTRHTHFASISTVHRLLIQNLTPEPEAKAKAKWKEFRKNEKASSMKGVCWKVKVHYSYDDEIKADLNGDLHYRVSLFTFSTDENGNVRKRSWKDAVRSGAYPKVHDDDVLVFTGKFVNVAESGSLNFVTSKIENLGPEN